MIPRAPESAIDLIEKCLKFRPSQRINAERAFQHDYIETFRDTIDHTEEDKINSDQGGDLDMPLNDNKTYKIEEYKNQIYEMMSKKNRENREAQAVLQYAKYKNYNF